MVPVMELAAVLKPDGGERPTGGGIAPRTPTSVKEKVIRMNSVSSFV